MVLLNSPNNLLGLRYTPLEQHRNTTTNTNTYYREYPSKNHLGVEPTAITAVPIYNRDRERERERRGGERHTSTGITERVRCGEYRVHCEDSLTVVVVVCVSETVREYIVTT